MHCWCGSVRIAVFSLNKSICVSLEYAEGSQLLILLFNLLKESRRVWKTSHPGSIYAEAGAWLGCGDPGGLDLGRGGDAPPEGFGTD